jgi:hypothetical protein
MSKGLIAVDEIEDLRSYERHREVTKAEMIAYRRMRRVTLGEIMSFTFENKKTVLYQIQEMARAERMLSDTQIQAEIDAYESLIPREGQLVGTLFIELTNKSELMYWLPTLTGIERKLSIVTEAGSFTSYPEEGHAEQLTRGDITPSVHYLVFDLSEKAQKVFLGSDVYLKVEHENYAAEALLSEEVKESIVADWNG